MFLPLLLFILLGAIALAVSLRRFPKKFRRWLLAAPAGCVFALLAIHAAPVVINQGAIAFSLPWVPKLNFDLAFYLGGPGLLLALLVTGIGTLILIYAEAYMDGQPMAYKLFAYLYAFMLSMLGLAMADHMLLFFIFWELTSITSYLLIGFNHEKAASRRNALQALLVTGMGGMALLAGFILLAEASGTWLISELAQNKDLILTHPNYPAIMALVLLGAFTKSAQFPFHFWLPNAMSAPTPVSAYLHSATMVKAGIFLLFLMLPVLGGTTAWTFSLTLAGGATLLIGGIFGLQQVDLKKILAGTTVAVLGLLTFLLGLGTEKAVLAALIFMVGHAFYKACLFMTAGAVEHGTGTRDTTLLGGLGSIMPWTATAAILAAVSKMGLPPFLGFIGKEYTYKASLYENLEWLPLTVLIAGNAIILVLAVRTGIFPFLSRKKTETLPAGSHSHEVSWPMYIGPILLGALGLVLGGAPFLIEPILKAAYQSITGKSTLPEIALWTGFNRPLLLSAMTVTIGLILLKYHTQIRQMLNRFALPTADQIYDHCFNSIIAFANWQTKRLQSGYLRNYLIIILGATMALVWANPRGFSGFPLFANIQSIHLAELVIVILMIAATLIAVVTRMKLTALIALGVVGFGVAILFGLYSAPDLAITQILVETLTIVLFAWLVYKLPSFKNFSARNTQVIDVVVSTCVGLTVTALVLKSNSINLGERISEQLATWSYPEAHGANVVNVILVDFRALDTFGEIIVLAIAAIGVWSLLENRSKKPKAD